MSRLCRIRRGQPQGTQSLCRCTSREITVVTRVKPCAVYRIGGVVKLCATFASIAARRWRDGDGPPPAPYATCWTQTAIPSHSATSNSPLMRITANSASCGFPTRERPPRRASSPAIRCPPPRVNLRCRTRGAFREAFAGGFPVPSAGSVPKGTILSCGENDQCTEVEDFVVGTPDRRLPLIDSPARQVSRGFCSAHSVGQLGAALSHLTGNQRALIEKLAWRSASRHRISGPRSCRLGVDAPCFVDAVDNSYAPMVPATSARD